jgi:iron complex outermembrane receptor protein
MRGVASGGDGNHSGSLPSVGVYLDEQPITTIQGALDIHIYDIARVEALAGPQGTLYGASSQAGTLRIITNKPSTAGSAPATTSRSTRSPMATTWAMWPRASSTSAAVDKSPCAWWAGPSTGGYIDNVAGTRTYPTSGRRSDQ